MADDGQGSSGGEEGGESGGNLVDFVSAKNKKNQRVKAKKEEISTADREACYLEAMRSGMPGWAPFPTRFQVLMDTRGVRSVLREEPGQVLIPVADVAAVNLLIEYSRNDPSGKGMPELYLNLPQARKIFDIWSAMQLPIPVESIAALREKSDPGYCYQRLPFDLAAGATPVFDELFSRIDNADAVQAFLGMTLRPNTDREQYVWIHGDGDNGKGSLVSFIEWIMGPSFRSEQPPKAGDKHWSSGLLGAGFVVLADCDDVRFVTTGLFKSFTGGDSIRVEPKGKDIFTAKMTCRFLIMSNRKPKITSSVADQRRAIYAEIAPLPAGKTRLPKHVYVELLKEEGAAFLFKCKEKALKLAPDGGRIPAKTKKTLELIAWNENEHQDFFSKYFEIDASPAAKIDDRAHVLPRHIQALARKEWSWNDQRLAEWYAWAERRNIRHKRMPKRLKQEIRVFGMKWRSEMINKPSTLDNGIG